MILPGYENPKTVCVMCWKKIIDSQEDAWNRLNELGDNEEQVLLAKNITILSNKAAAFLARGGYYYSWEMIRHHVNGYHVYQHVLFLFFPNP